MKTSNIEVHDMLSVLSVVGVEERIGKVPGVESVTVNFAAENATVRYDETRLDIHDIKAAVRQSGYQAEGESLTKKVSEHDAVSKQSAQTSSAAAPKPSPAAPTPTTAAPKTATGPAATAQPDKAEPSTTPKPSPIAPAAAPKPTGINET